VLEGSVVEREREVERLRQAAGCFVLLTNVPTEGEMAHAPGEVLAAYKDASRSFLKGTFVRPRTIRPSAIEVRSVPRARCDLCGAELRGGRLRYWMISPRSTDERVCACLTCRNAALGEGYRPA
jgi:hypothetical protein